MVAPIVAIVFLIPAPISALNAWKKRKLLNDQKSIQTIRELSWRQFEALVAEVYRRQIKQKWPYLLCSMQKLANL